MLAKRIETGVYAAELSVKPAVAQAPLPVQRRSELELTAREGSCRALKPAGEYGRP